MVAITGSVYRYIGSATRFADAVVNGFNPRFNAEDFTWLTEVTNGRVSVGTGGRVDFAEVSTGYNWPSYLLVAMVSFCTITPDESAAHQSRYGKNMIKLSRDWATRNGLRHLVYLERDDILTTEEKRQVVLALRKRPLPAAEIISKWPDIPFWKPHIGAMPVREEDREIGELSNIDDFFEEREVRYVPDKFLDRTELTHDIETTHKRMDELTKLTAGFRLTFDDADAEQVIVETDATRNDILGRQPGLRGKIFLWSELNLATSP